jgi:hypothetical protein
MSKSKENRFLNNSIIELALGFTLLLGVLFLYLDRYIFKSIPIFLLKFYIFDYISSNYILISIILLVISTLLYIISSYSGNGGSGGKGESEEGNGIGSGGDTDIKKFMYAFARNPLLFNEETQKKLLSQESASVGLAKIGAASNISKAEKDTSSNLALSNSSKSNSEKSNNILIQVAKYLYFIIAISIIVIHLISYFYYSNLFNDYFYYSVNEQKIIKVKIDNVEKIFEIPFKLSELPLKEQKSKVKLYWKNDSTKEAELKQIRRLINDFQYGNLEIEIEKMKKARK